MNDSNEWELSKENVQPLRRGRKVSSLTSALQHTPADLQHIKEEKDMFEKQLRLYDGDDPLEVWDEYIKWTEQNYPRGGKDGNLTELLQRCLTHFKDLDVYKNDPRFVQIWIKFANFIDDPLEIYSYMFDQSIGCGLASLYEEWAGFLERTGNTKKADTIYMEGIFQGGSAVGCPEAAAQPREEEEPMDEEQRMILGRLKADKKNRVGTTRTGTVKLEVLVGDHQWVSDVENVAEASVDEGLQLVGACLGGPARGFAVAQAAPQQLAQPTFQVFQDENAPITSGPQQTGEWKTVPKREQTNRENEQAPGVWTKARVSQRKGASASGSGGLPQPTFHIHEDENVNQPHHVPVVDKNVLSARKAERPGHMLDTIKNQQATSSERPMYCKDKVYCGTEEFSFEEIRALKYTEKRRRRQMEEEQLKLAQQIEEMRLLKEQMQMEFEQMKAQRQMLAYQAHPGAPPQMRLSMSSRESTGVQPSPQDFSGANLSQQTPSQSAPFQQGPPSSSSSSFTGMGRSHPPNRMPMAAGPHNINLNNSQQTPVFHTSSHSMGLSSSGSSSAHQPGHQVRSAGPTLDSSMTSQRTPVFNSSSSACVGSASSQYQLQQSRSAGPTPESNTSKHSLTGASPTINMKEALQMVQGMYNATLDCDRMQAWAPEDTEMTGAVDGLAPAPANSAPFAVFDESKQKPAQPAIAIFCDENVDQENRPPKPAGQQGRVAVGRGLSAAKMVLQEKPISGPAPTGHASQPRQMVPAAAEEEPMHEGTEFYPHYDVTLAAVGSQESFAAAAHAASTPFGLAGSDGRRLPSFPLSSIKPNKVVVHQQHSDEEMDGSGDHVQPGQSRSQLQQQQQYQTFNTTGVTPNKNDLSPIIEGSTEGSSEESKSQAASTLGASHSHSHVSTSGLSVRTPATGSKTRSSKQNTDMLPLPEDPTDQHVIDTSAYVPPEPDEKTEALLSMSVCIDPHNPFDAATISNFLKRVQPPVSRRPGYVACSQQVPDFSNCQFINLGDDTYQLMGLIGEGGYAKVYRASKFDTDFDDSMDDMAVDGSSSCVIKVQKPAAPWEFYICSEVQERLRRLAGPFDVRPAMNEISKGYFYHDGSCLVSEFCPLGSLLTLANQIKGQRDLMANLEPLAVYLTVQLLHMVEALHRCRIIHGDIKPDNILLTGFPEVRVSSDVDKVFGHWSQCLRLVDFGQAIDMSLYPSGTTFMAQVGTSGFQCIEMMTDRPWTYQTDLFGLVGSIHVLVFGQYMKVYCSQGQWHMTSSFQRKWKVDLWKKLFHQLLNIEDCDHQPDLAALRREFEQHFISNLIHGFQPVLARIRAIAS
ncbi:hypothetical protein BaRGS_00024090 [Batillaria attramentaria]|uniref:Mitotic checkpoint serine/threonine-protein kinase BUB1 n=1 Tax=Batillaria attramentaria TaxID=370345 RepID=A0ABD0KCB2_9CAEN